MNKLTIPAILVATVMVAGIFAFIPVEQASTVHETIQDSQLQIKTTTDTVAITDGGATTAGTVTINLGAPFQLIAFTIECNPGDPSTGTDTTFCEVGESMQITTLAIDGQADAFDITMTVETGVSTDDDPAVVLNLFGVDAEATADASGLPQFIGAADRIVIGFTTDTDAADVGDDGFTMTVRVTVITQGDTTVSAAEIAFA